MRPIWVVDDQLVVANALAALLQTNGYETTVVSDGKEVIRRIGTEGEPLLMILDLDMPHNGNILIDLIMANSYWTFPVIVLSGYEDELSKDVRGRVFRSLAKTVEIDVLLETVRKAIGELP